MMASSGHQVAFQPLLSAGQESISHLPGVETLPALVEPGEAWPPAQRWSAHMHDPIRVHALAAKAAANIRSCDLVWICCWWRLGSELGELGRTLNAPVVADGDVLSLAHLLHSRTLAGESAIKAGKELAWAARYLNWEVRSLRKATCVVVPSSREVRFVSRFVRGPVRMVRNIVSDLVDLSGVRAASDSPPAVLFMGDMRFEPNRHAARFLARDVWPRLRRRLDGAMRPKLLLGGWEAASLLIDSVPAGDADVIVRSDVNEVSDLFHDCQVVAVPVFFGGGSPHKVMEAAASGRPVICSSYVASTLEAVEESGFFVCDSADDYARHLAELLSDQELACRRQRQARLWAETHYSIDAWVADVNELGRTVGVGELVSQ